MVKPSDERESANNDNKCRRCSLVSLPALSPFDLAVANIHHHLKTSTSNPRPVASRKICMLPASEGVCAANLTRWHYDRESLGCKKFSFGGCAGNANNFRTLQECHGICVGQLELVGGGGGGGGD